MTGLRWVARSAIEWPVGIPLPGHNIDPVLARSGPAAIGGIPVLAIWGTEDRVFIAAVPRNGGFNLTIVFALRLAKSVQTAPELCAGDMRTVRRAGSWVD